MLVPSLLFPVARVWILYAQDAAVLFPGSPPSVTNPKLVFLHSTLDNESVFVRILQALNICSLICGCVVSVGSFKCDRNGDELGWG